MAAGASLAFHRGDGVDDLGQERDALVPGLRILLDVVGVLRAANPERDKDDDQRHRQPDQECRAEQVPEEVDGQQQPGGCAENPLVNLRSRLENMDSLPWN